MAIKSSKHQNVQQVTMVLNGGLNYAQSSANISDNELKRAMNFIYDPATDFLMTRPGTSCQTTTALPNPILNGYYYEKSSSVAYHVCASGGKLYKVTGAGLDTYTEIGSLTDDETVPSFLTFNNKLLIADGGSAIRTWDGTTYTTISGSPKASVLSMIKNRVVCNAVDELDSVYLSAPNDESVWNTSTTAVGLKAGFGDTLAVNAFAVFGDDLIISKLGDREKRIYRVNVSDSTTSSWYVQDLSQNNASQNSHTMLAAWNNVYFVDSNGFKSIKGINEYGDLQVDAIGRKVNTLFTSWYACNGVFYLPSYNAIWFNLGNRVFAYTERYSSEMGRNIPAFTDMEFKWGQCTSIYEAGDTVFLTGHDGLLHKIDELLDTDEVTPGVTQHYLSSARTRTLTYVYDGILRKLQWYLKPKAAGSGNLYICTDEDTKVRCGTFDSVSEGTYLYDATGYLDDATEDLYDTGTVSWVETTRDRVRSDEMAFELELTEGRVGVEWCKAEIAILEGGD